ERVAGVTGDEVDAAVARGGFAGDVDLALVEVDADDRAAVAVLAQVEGQEADAAADVDQRLRTALQMLEHGAVGRIDGRLPADIALQAAAFVERRQAPG